MDIAHLRKQYNNEPLDENLVKLNPFEQFNLWFEEAMIAQLPEPNAMILSTVDKLNRPHARTVLLKGIENDQFVFYTNFQSQKGKHISLNPFISLTFLWLELERQVRINGKAEKVANAVADEYFASRPLGSRIGAHVSEQSTTIPSRQFLENKLKRVEEEFNGRPVNRPAHWGGYTVKAYEIEFWKGRPDRLHDRILYSLNEDQKWIISRLSP